MTKRTVWIVALLVVGTLNALAGFVKQDVVSTVVALACLFFAGAWYGVEDQP